MRDAYRRAKNEFVRMYDHAQRPEVKAWWAKRVAWCDKKLKQQRSREIELAKRIKIWVIIVNVASLLSIVTGCTTVQGIGTDITWMGSAGQEMLQDGHKCMEK